jgi:16S rRNA processing protein RimM
MTTSREQQTAGGAEVGAGEGGVDDLISIAVIARPHGVRGEVVADVLTDFPERFEELAAVKVVRHGALLGELKIEDARFHKERLLLKFAGYDTVERAGELREARLVISRDELVELPADNYYEFDLIGCEVETVEGLRVGRVAAVNDFGAAPLLVVKDGGREHLIPLTRDICTEVDTGAKRIRIAPPEGLLEL